MPPSLVAPTRERFWKVSENWLMSGTDSLRSVRDRFSEKCPRLILWELSGTDSMRIVRDWFSEKCPGLILCSVSMTDSLRSVRDWFSDECEGLDGDYQGLSSLDSVFLGGDLLQGLPRSMSGHDSCSTCQLYLLSIYVQCTVYTVLMSL